MAYVTNVSSVSNLLRSSLYVLQTLLGDICLVGNITVALSLVAPLKMILFFFSQIYRCSVVWLHNIWIIILPILIWISCAGKWTILWVHHKRWRTCPNLATGVGTIISFSKVSPEAQVFSIEGWVTAFFAATLSTNVICTCTSSYWYTIPFLDLAFAYSAMIVYRIWSIEWACGKCRDPKSTLMPVLVVVIESGAIYSASLTILLVIFLSHSLAYFILVHAVSSFHNGTHHSNSWTWVDDPNHCEILHVVIYSIIWLT